MDGLNNREHASIIMALRLLQVTKSLPSEERPWLIDIATNGGEFEPLNNDEIDVLIEEKLQAVK